MKTKLITAALAISAALSVAAPASAQPYGDARGGGYRLDLQGQSVDSAKRTLASAGYRAQRSIRYDGKQYDLWSNAGARNSCVGFTSYNGRVTDSRGFDDSQCGLVGGGWGRGRFDADDLRGLRVDDAKRNLRDYGYSNTRNIRLDGQQWDLWESSRGRDCIGFTSYRGTITGVRDFRDCDGGGYGGGWGGRLDADDLRGLSVDSAKRALADAGYRGARKVDVRGQRWDLFYSDGGRGRCVGFTSYYGRVTDAREFSDRDCY